MLRIWVPYADAPVPVTFTLGLSIDMKSPDKVVLTLSKRKLALRIVCAIAFLWLGLWMLSQDAAEIAVQRRYNNPTIVHANGLAVVIFASAATVAYFIKLFDRKPCLVFDSEGVLINSLAASSVFIPWKDISGFYVFKFRTARVLVVLLYNPERYIASGGAIRRFLNRANYNLAGSPISIPTFALNLGFDQLTTLCNEYFERFGPPKEPHPRSNEHRSA